jgi:hypothetical protein
MFNITTDVNYENFLMFTLQYTLRFTYGVSKMMMMMMINFSRGNTLFMQIVSEIIHT